MSNAAVDHQVRIALRDNQKAEKFAEHIAEIAAQIVNSTFKFAEDVKSAYESGSFPKRRRSDKHFDETDHAKLALGAFSFFMHVLDRYLLEIDIKIVREAVLDLILGNVVQRVYARSFTGPLGQTEKFVLNHLDRRAAQLAEAPTIVGDNPEDKTSAIWCASRAICEEDLGRDDGRLLVIVQTHLLQALRGLALPENITAIAEMLCVPQFTAQNNEEQFSKSGSGRAENALKSDPNCPLQVVPYSTKSALSA